MSYGNYAMMAVGGVLNILGGVSAGLSATKEMKALGAQAGYAYETTKKEGQAVIGAQQAAMGSSGFDTGSTTYQAIGLESAHQAELNALWARYGYAAAKNRVRQQRLQTLFSSLNQSLQSMGGSGYDYSSLYNEGRAASGSRLSGGSGFSGFGSGQTFTTSETSSLYGLSSGFFA